MPREICSEVFLVSIDLVVAESNARWPISTQVTATDATPTRGGTVFYSVSRSMAHALWMSSELKGFCTSLRRDRLHTLPEVATEKNPADDPSRKKELRPRVPPPSWLVDLCITEHRLLSGSEQVPPELKMFREAVSGGANLIRCMRKYAIPTGRPLEAFPSDDHTGRVGDTSFGMIGMIWTTRKQLFIWSSRFVGACLVI